MFLTRRFAYCCVAVIVLLSLGYLWTFFFYVGYVLCGLFVLAITVNVLRLYVGKRKVVAVRQTPDRLSIGDDNEVLIKVHNGFKRKVRLQIYDEAPFSFQMRDLKLEFELEGEADTDVKYFVRPTRRGSYVFHNVNTFVSLWPHLVLRRFKSDQTCRTKVYPSFLFLRNSQLLSVSNRERMWGTKLVRRIGQSKEFEKIREYVVGDDYRSINWKASARKHNFMVNENQEEQSQNIYAVVDKGRGMQHTFNGLSLFDHSLNSSLQLAYLSLQHSDNVGLITFEKDVNTFIQANRSTLQLNRMVSTLYDEVSSFRQSDYFNLYEFCKRKIQKRSLLIIYTTFDSMTSLRRQLPFLKKLALAHVVLVTFFIDKDLDDMLRDKAENALDCVTQMVAQKFIFEQRLIVNELKRHGIYSLLTAPENLNANVLNRYLEFKSRHIL